MNVPMDFLGRLFFVRFSATQTIARLSRKPVYCLFNLRQRVVSIIGEKSSMTTTLRWLLRGRSNA